MDDDLDELIERELLDIDDFELSDHDQDVMEDMVSMKLHLLSSSHPILGSDVRSPSTRKSSQLLEIDQLMDYISGNFVDRIDNVNDDDVISPHANTSSEQQDDLVSLLSPSTLISIPDRMSFTEYNTQEDAVIFHEVIDGIISSLDINVIYHPTKRKDIQPVKANLDDLPQLFEEDEVVSEDNKCILHTGESFDYSYLLPLMDFNSMEMTPSDLSVSDAYTAHPDTDITVSPRNNDASDTSHSTEKTVLSDIVANGNIPSRLTKLHEESQRLKKDNRAVHIQAWFRCRIATRHYQHHRNLQRQRQSAVIILQTFIRMAQAKMRATYQRQIHVHRALLSNSAISLQAWCRGNIARKQYLKLQLQMQQQRCINDQRIKQEQELHQYELKQAEIESSYMMIEDEASTALRVASELHMDDDQPTASPYQRKLLSESEIVELIKSLQSTWRDTIIKCWKNPIEPQPASTSTLISSSSSSPSSSQQKSNIDPSTVTASCWSMESYVKAWQRNTAVNEDIFNHRLHAPATLPNSISPSNHISSPSSTSAELTMLQDLGLHQSDPLTIYTLELSVEGIISASFLQCCRNLIKVNLNVNKLKSIQGIESLINLTHLSICDNKLESLAPLHHLHQLKSLSADRNRIHDISPIASLSKLVTLSLTCNAIEALPDHMMLPSLQTLKLELNKLVTLSASSFHHMTSLTYLSIERNQLSAIDPLLFAGLCMPILQTLILSHNTLTNLPSPMLQPLLRNLWITGNQILNFNTWKGSTSIFMPMLEKLYLQDNQIDVICEGVFQCLPMLSEMNLSFNQIRLKEKLQGLSDCKSLKTLVIHDNPISSTTSPSSLHRHDGGSNDDISDWKLLMLSYCPSVLMISDTAVDACMRRTAIESTAKPDLTYHYFMCSHHRSATRMVSYPLMKSPDYMEYFIHMINRLVLEQNSLRSEEMMDKRQHAGSSAGRKNNANQLPDTVVLHERLLDEYWEETYINLLHQHVNMIISFDHTSYVPAILDIKHHIDMKSSWMEAEADDRLKLYQSYLIKASDRNRHLSHACICIQACWRGYKTRKRMKIALSSIRYVDDELDELFLDHDQASFLNDLSILTAADIEVEIISQATRRNSSGSNTLVYGDHRRPRHTPTHIAKSSLSSSDEVDMISNDYLSTRPSSSHSNATSMSSISNVSVQENRRTLDYDNTDEVSALIQQYSEMKDRHDNTSQSNYSQRIAEEWGIIDPRVAATLAKRNKRYKAMEDTKTRREQEKDPNVRYQRFVKNTMKSGSGNMNIESSGSFGGKPKQTRTIRNRGKGPMPAWALSEAENEHYTAK